MVQINVSKLILWYDWNGEYTWILTQFIIIIIISIATDAGTLYTAFHTNAWIYVRIQIAIEFGKSVHSHVIFDVGIYVRRHI